MPVTAQTHAMNLKVLQRHDPSILSIVDSATYVVLYHYDEKEGGWKKEGIEGSMFIFRRSISPPLGLFILNRHGLKNWTRPITFNTEFDIQGKTLMLNEQGAQEDTEDAKISGLWVHDVAEGEKLLELLSSLRSSLPTPSPPPPPAPPAPVETNGSLSFAEILQRLQSPAITSSTPSTPSRQPPSHLHIQATTATATVLAPHATPRGTELLDLLFSTLSTSSTPSASNSPALAHTPAAAYLLPTDPNPSSSSASSAAGGSSTGNSPLVQSSTPNGKNSSASSRRNRTHPETSSQSTTTDDSTTTTPRRKSSRRAKADAPIQPTGEPKQIVQEELEEEIVWKMKETGGTGEEEVLDRYEFVRQLSGLLRSDPGFVDRLYGRYLEGGRSG